MTEGGRRSGSVSKVSAVQAFSDIEGNKARRESGNEEESKIKSSEGSGSRRSVSDLEKPIDDVHLGDDDVF